MSLTFDSLVGAFKRLPGVGFRSAERMALHLLLERPEDFLPLMAALENARANLHACPICGNLAEGETCDICADVRRDAGLVCVVERVPDLVALERAGGFRGVYHVLGGKLSPINGVGEENLNWAGLRARLAGGEVRELILALGNDIEAEATCHAIISEMTSSCLGLKVSRIAFGVPSGSSLTYTDQITLRSAMDGRRELPQASAPAGISAAPQPASADLTVEHSKILC
jgi:recombination protein RecR